MGMTASSTQERILSFTLSIKQEEDSSMNACRKSLVGAALAVLLTLSLGVNMSQARAHPHFLGFPSFKAFQAHSQSGDRKNYSSKPVSESLRRIPPSDPNPTQNR